MFRNILIGTALTLVAATTSFTPAFAKSVPHNYPDRCKTAFENFQQAKWEKSHKTAQGNLGGAEGWDELEEASEKSADDYRAREAEYKENAKQAKATAEAGLSDFSTKQARASEDFWNKAAEDASWWVKRQEEEAKDRRTKAKQMREDAKDYENAAWKALMECLDVNAETFTRVPSYEDFVNNDKPVEETTATAEQPEPEKKPKKKPVRKTQKPEKKPKVAKVNKPATATPTEAESIAREVFVNVATGIILGKINGHGMSNGHKHEKHHKAKRHQMQEGHAMGNGKSHRKMKKNKRMSSMF